MRANNHHLPYSCITKFLDDLKEDPSSQCMTRNIINKTFLKSKENLKEKRKNHDQKNKYVGMIIDIQTIYDSAEPSELKGGMPSQIISESVTSQRFKGGKPNGTTIKKEEQVKRIFQIMKKKIAERFST